jgi:hypothetical protein
MHMGAKTAPTKLRNNSNYMWIFYKLSPMATALRVDVYAPIVL